MLTLAIVAGALVYLGIAAFAWSLCRMAALADAAAARETEERRARP